MENALLYTFTTIAQALGGTFALLAAFILYRFQTLNDLMALDAGELMPIVSHDENKKALHTQFANEARFLEMIRALRAELRGSDPPSAFVRLQNCAARRHAIGLYFSISAWMTGLVMIGSVVCIGFAQFLRSNNTAAWSALVAGWLGFSACIVLYGVVIGKSIRR
jgi:hypothetical protein